MTKKCKLYLKNWFFELIKSIKVLLNSRECYVIKRGETLKHFKLGKETWQDDPIKLSNIKSFQIFHYKFIYMANADDTTFSLKNIVSVINLLDAFKRFLHFPSFKSNGSKCEIASRK